MKSQIHYHNIPRDLISHYNRFAIHTLTFTTLFIVTSSLFLLVLSLNDNHLVAAKNTHEQQQTTYLQRPDSNGRPLLMVASYCPNNQQNELGPPSSSQQQYYSQYLEIETGKWRSNRDSSTGAGACGQDKQDILNMCKKAYPNHDVRNIVESSRSYKIENWCKINSNSKKRCHSRFTVKPYRCLEGTFQSDALLVPDRCLFDHLHNKTICENSTNWNKIASDNCYYKSMKLESFSMLQPCGLGVFSGVEFVCCPHQTQQQSSTTESPIAKVVSSSAPSNSFAQSANIRSHDSASSPKSNNKSIKNKDRVDGDNNDAPTSGTEDDDDAWDSNEDEDEDEYDDDSSSSSPSFSQSTQTPSSTSTSTTTTTTTTSTTTTTERPIDHYLAHFDVAKERDEYKHAETAVENTYRDKITSVIKNWSQVDSRYEEMKKRDAQGAEQFKKSMTANLEKTIQALEEEAENQRHQLAAMHAERAMAIINRRKKSAMDCLTQALDRDPIRIKQVEKCIVRLLKALEKDREHTFRQYKNLLILNTREGLHEKKIILDHLVTLNRAANQSIAMLHRSSLLVDELKGKVVGLWHKMRKIPLDQPIDRELEVKMMEKIEEEVAQRKIQQERERMAYKQDKLVQEVVEKSKQQEKSQQHADNEINKINNNNLNESKGDSKEQDFKASGGESTVASNSDNKPVVVSTSSSFDQIVPDQVMVEPQTNQIESNNNNNSSSVNEPSDEAENEIRDQGVDVPKFSHLKADPSHHELTFSIKHEPVGGESGTKWALAHPLFMISMCTLIVAISLMGFRYYNKNSARTYKRQGFAEVGRSCPEEKTVTNLQFNGYENPAYKFFEAEA